jgi:hypothetical protein
MKHYRTASLLGVWILDLLLALAGGASETRQLATLAAEGVKLTERVSLGSSPEMTLQTARDLLSHASRYDDFMHGAPDEIHKAQRLQQRERQTSATFMRQAAGDYTKRNEFAKARDVYNAMLSSFLGVEFRLIRESAEATLKQLDEIEALPSAK